MNCQCTQCRMTQYPAAVMFAPMFNSQPFWLTSEVRNALVKALKDMPSRAERRNRPGMRSYEWCATYLQTEFGWKFSPFTVKTMLSLFGLTNKKDKL